MCHGYVVTIVALALPSLLALAGDRRAAVGGTAPLRTDALGDPLPAGAVARLGSNRFRVLGWVRAVAFAADDRTVLACTHDDLRVWERATGKLIRRFKLPAHRVAAFSQDATALVLVDDQGFGIYDTASAKQRLRVKGALPTGWGTPRPAFSPDGKLVAITREGIGDRGRSLQLYDAATGKDVATLRGVKTVRAFAFSPDGRYLAVGQNTSPIRLWDIRARAYFKDIAVSDRVFYADYLSFSPDSKRIACMHGPVTIFDINTGQRITGFGEHWNANQLAFVPDGRRLITASQGRGVHVWDISQQKKIRDLSKDWRRFPLIAVSHDGKTLAVGDMNADYRQLRLWNLDDYRELPNEPGHATALNLMAFAADGDRLVTGDRTQVVTWDARTGQRRDRQSWDIEYPVPAPISSAWQGSGQNRFNSPTEQRANA